MAITADTSTAGYDAVRDILAILDLPDTPNYTDLVVIALKAQGTEQATHDEAIRLLGRRPESFETARFEALGQPFGQRVDPDRLAKLRTNVKDFEAGRPLTYRIVNSK